MKSLRIGFSKLVRRLFSMVMANGHSKSITVKRAFFFGVIMNALFLILLLILGSAIISSTEDPIKSVGIGSVAVLYLSAFISGFITARRKGEGGFIPVLLSSLFFSLMLLMAGLVVSGGEPAPLSAINCPVYVVISLLGATLAKNRKRRRHR